MGILQDVFAGAASLTKAAFGGFRLNPLMRGHGSRMMADLLQSGGSQGFPGSWTGSRLEQVRHFRGWTYVAIKAICEEVACNPPQIAAIRTRQEATQRGLKMLTPYERYKTLATLQSHEELEPVDSSHPFCRLMNNPNGPDVSYDFWYETMMFLELTGNAYWWVIENGLNLPAELWVLPSHWVWPYSKGGSGRLVDYYEVRPYGSPGSYRQLKIDANDIIHFKYKNPISKIDGLAPIQAAAEWIDTSESIDKARWRSFRNGLWPGMVLTLDDSIEDPDEPTLNRIYSRLDARMRGEQNYDRPMILPKGVTPEATTRSPREMDFQQSGDQLRDWQMAVHRVGKTVAGITEDVNYNNMIASTANFCTRTIRPKLSYVGQVGTEKLARRFDERLVMYWKDLAPDDPAQKTADLKADYDMNALTKNEARAARGRAPVPGGDVFPLDQQQQQQGAPQDGGGDQDQDQYGSIDLFSKRLDRAMAVIEKAIQRPGKVHRTKSIGGPIRLPRRK